MLYKFFNAIATQLSSQVAALTGVEWFNAQYDGTILKTPVCYIEFPEPINPEEVSKDLQRATITVRLHTVSKVITKIDNTVPDQAVIDHETIAIAVRDCMRGQLLTQTTSVVVPETETDLEEIVSTTVNISSRLRWVRWQHFHKFQGWMVTTCDFTFKSSDFD